MKSQSEKYHAVSVCLLGFAFCLFALFFVSCETLDHWLFNASDYSIRDSKNDDEDGILNERDIYWDDVDFDIWYDENEYD